MTSRRLLALAHDGLATALALVGSFLLRWGQAEFLDRLGPILFACALALPVALASYWAFRLDRSPWKFASVPDVGRIALAVTVPALFLVLVDFLSRGALIVPRTVPVIYGTLQLCLLAAPRLAYRAYRARRDERRAFRGRHRLPVLIAGTDEEAHALIGRFRRDGIRSLEPVGLLSGRAREIGQRIGQVPVVGAFSDLDAALAAPELRGARPARLVLTAGAMRSGAVDGLVLAARRNGLAVLRTSDPLADLPDAASPPPLAPVSIDDLLGRPARELDLAPVRTLLSGRRVAVTGAGGTIGSELCRQAASLGAAEQLLLDISELALWQVGSRLAQLRPDLGLTRCLVDIRDPEEVSRAFGAFRPEVVFHAAALKHVDIAEAHPVAAARTNTLGTAHVAESCLACGASCAVFISTDKAVEPVSILGATKRAGELVWAASDLRARREGAGTRFVVVRFGNVLGSSGSVIPLFRGQIEAGGPVTVTHPDVERYFMTVEEAVRLVLMASSLGGAAPEAAPVHVLDMGEPIRILDLARRMIRLAGMEPDREIAITFSGLRPGERLSERLESRDERLRPTVVPGVQATDAPALDVARLARQLDGLRRAAEARDPAATRSSLARTDRHSRRLVAALGERLGHGP